MISRADVLRQLAIEDTSEATAAASVDPIGAHVEAARAALGLLAEREVTSTAELIHYAQAEATLALALTIRTLLEKR